LRKILIVDDQEEIRDLVEKTLRRTDRKVYKADSGKKAIEIARAQKPDLIMMDIMMPGTIDGLEATRALKNDPVTKDCIVIMLTAKSRASDIGRAAEVGADGYFTKPFSPLELLRKVDELIG
jgi:CheY-like chemotaxis protein